MRRLLALLVLAAAAVPLDAQLLDYRRADSVALAVPRHAATDLDSLAAYLSRGLETDEERARAIYRWVTENIDYDVGTFLSGGSMARQTAQRVLRTRRAVCDGYSVLVWELGRRMGLEVGVVSGWAKGAARDGRGMPRRGGHSWNGFRINGQWRLMDATWGAGDVVGTQFVRRIRDFFFFTDPAKMIFSHLPQDPRWQLLERPLSSAEFDAQPVPSRDFWDLGFDPEQVRNAGRELLGAFPMQERPVRVRTAPLAGRLQPGQVVQLSLEAPGATEVIAISGDRWQPLTATQGVFAGEAAMAADRLVVMIRYPDRPEGSVVLEWRAAPR